MVRSLSIVLALLCAVAAPAFAQRFQKERDVLAERFTDRTFGRWRVYGYGNACWMVTHIGTHPDAQLSISVDRENLFLMASDHGWDALDQSGWLLGHAQFGDVDVPLRETWGLTEYADGGFELNEVGWSGGFSTLIVGKASYLTPLGNAPRFKLSLGAAAVDIDLAGSGPAFAYMKRCAAASRRLPRDRDD
jgi:hypothetical protein